MCLFHSGIQNIGAGSKEHAAIARSIREEVNWKLQQVLINPQCIRFHYKELLSYICIGNLYDTLNPA